MRLPLFWMTDYVDPGLSPAKLAERLDLTGTEVDRVFTHGVTALDNFVVGRVLSAEQHPDADRLRVCEVDDGSGSPRTIVCGAPNVAGGHVRRAADDLLGLGAVADVDLADAQAVGVGVLLGAEHLADHEVLERADAVVVHGLDLRAGHRQALLELLDGQGGVGVLREPFDGNAHQPNCSRKRRSLS